MKTSVVIYVVAAVVIGALFVANWASLSSVASINLLFGRVEAPLALLLLLCLGVILLMNLAVHALTARTWRVERRKLLSELDAERARAEREEESRIQALRLTSEREFVAIREQLDQVLARQAALLGRERPDEVAGTAITPATLEPELIPPRPAPVRGRY